MATLMERIQTGTETRPRRVLIYGPHGIGKSTWAAGAPSPIVIQTEDGLDEIDVPKFPLAQSFGDVMQALRELGEAEHGFRTVIVDTADWLEQLIWSQVCIDHGNVGNIEDIGYGKGYTFALTLWRNVLDHLNWLRTRRNMMVILTAHAQIEKFEPPDGAPFDRYSPKLHTNSKGKGANAMVQEWCDEILFAGYKVTTKQEERGFNKKTTKALDSERVVYTSEHPARIAKRRLRELPEILPLDFAAFAKFLPDTGGVTSPVPTPATRPAPMPTQDVKEL